ncbi:MAG: N-succinylarginine dihydrolase [Pseudomonadota bacterium]
MTREVNFDGLVGPSHNYGGLSQGNIASMSHGGGVSNPKSAAKQGLAKMRRLISLGLTQAVLPPHERPHIPTLHRLGFAGSDREIIEHAAKTAPALLANVTSASCMWTANAATVSPSADTADGRVHFTPASLSAMFHRSIEHPVTGRVLKAIFADDARFAHHVAVPAGGRMGDEGAANHGRMGAAHGDASLELFVYGRSAFERDEGAKRFDARQALECSEAVAYQHQLKPEQTLFIRQAAKAIDAGAFHNDVVSVANGPALMFHEHAFEDREGTLDAIRAAAEPLGFEPVFLEARADDVSLDDAITSYLFNSQLVTLLDGGMALILPTEAEETASTKAWVDAQIAANGPINEAHYLDLKQSMSNGGGPACLRLRVALSDEELDALGAAVILDDAKISVLEDWVERHYRDRLEPADISDPDLLDECRASLDELTQILDLGSVYDFQL